MDGLMSRSSSRRHLMELVVRNITFFIVILIVENDSQIKYRKTKEYCVSVLGYKQLLNPGRDCSADYQCITQKCKEGQCLGLIEN